MLEANEFSAAKNDGKYQYTKGGELSLNGLNYIGEYHIQGSVYKTGPVATKESITLQRVYKNADHYSYDRFFDFKIPVLGYIEPVPHLYAPQEQIYTAGYDSRYFVEKYDSDDSYAIEIDQAQYRVIGKDKAIDAGLYAHTAILWKVTGRREDIIAHNETELYKASSKIPTINYTVKNFLEFARITLV